jgi:hypothetical protein
MRPDRYCVDCGQPTGSVRRKRCPDCKRLDHARAQRERRAAESGQASDHVDLEDEPTVDYTNGGTPPPSYDIPKRPIPRWMKPETSDLPDGRVLSPMERFKAQQLDLSGVGARDWQDWVRAHRLAAAQKAEQELPDVMS